MTEANLYKLAKEKINRTFEGNYYTYYGQFMEPFIRNYINQQYDYDFHPETIINGIYRGNCDGLSANHKKLLEIKTYGSDQKVNYYNPQLQLYMHLFDVSVCILVCYNRPSNFFTWGDITDPQSYNLNFDDSKLDVYYIQRDRKLWNQMDVKLKRFYKALTKLRVNPNLTEREFNIILYGKKLVELLENYQDTKLIEKICMDQNITKAQIGDVSLTFYQVTEITVDSEKLWVERPQVFETYKIIKRSNQLKIRRRK